MQTLTSFAAPLVALFPLAAGLWCRWLPAGAAGRTATRAAGVSLAVSAALAATALATGGGLEGGWFALDGPALVMAVLVSFVGTMVLRFSRNHLAGDPAQARFFSWMCLTLGAVLLMVTAGHLALLFAAWVTTSLCLHRLLLHRPERPGAVFSARKKFVFSRIGDACLLGALAILFRGHGTLWIDGLSASIAAGNTAGLTSAAFLIAFAAALKSAQFPFHSWLPDTMETPTPVSAFMHAGIINAGGFLVIRMAPVFAHASTALAMLAVLGALTAAFGAIVMLAQPGVKRALAYSTIAQMGFMMMQCGFGAYGLALLHIVAHSLYKAHAFLTAGSTVGAVPRMAVKLGTPQLVAGALAGTALAMSAHFLVPGAGQTPAVFTVILSLALAYGLGRAWSVAAGPRMILGSVGIAVLVAFAGPLLHRMADHWFPAASPASWDSFPVLFAAAVFSGLFVFQILLWRSGRHPLGRALYVHALNGFYIGTLANRMLGRLWPAHPVSIN